MEIRDNENICIIAPLSTHLGARESKRIFEELSQEKRHSAIDLAHVTHCSLDFIEDLKKLTNTKSIGIFNIPSDIFALFNIMKVDKYVSLFVNQIDFEENARHLVNRSFSII